MGSRSLPGALCRPGPITRVLVFGPQALGFNANAAGELRSTLLNIPDLRWALDAIRGLPAYWDELSDAVPTLRHLPGATFLRDLSNWIVGAEGNLQTPFPLPNIILTPLVVITHLSQYWKF